MPQRQSRRADRPERSPSATGNASADAPTPAEVAANSESSEWANSRPKHSARTSNLPRLIDMDAPLSSHSTLVLMYGPFQAEMKSEAGQGVATWIKDCLGKHGPAWCASTIATAPKSTAAMSFNPGWSR
jgi:hypothetical protein